MSTDKMHSRQCTVYESQMGNKMTNNCQQIVRKLYLTRYLKISDQSVPNDFSFRVQFLRWYCNDGENAFSLENDT